MYRLIAAAVLIAAMPAAQAAADQRTVIYRSPFNLWDESGSFYNLERKSMGAKGYSRIWPVRTCDASSPYDCLYSEDFDFALSVPKQHMPDGHTWRIGKYRFVIRHGGTTRLAGRQLNYSVIDTIFPDAIDDHAHIRSAYDPTFGIVCYTYLNWKEPLTGKERPYADEQETACAEDIGLWPRQP